MINSQNQELTPSLEQLVMFHFEQAKYFERLKMASVNSPVLFYHYAAQEFYNKSLEHQYKAMLVGVMIPRTTMVGANENNKPQSTTFNHALLNSLRGGGYILYVRHGVALVGEDQPNLNLQYCSTQRNLSEVGRKQAVTYGKALRILRIPVKYPVLASPFCRTRETAELAFGAENVQVEPFWVEIYKLSGNLSSMEQNRIVDSLHSLLEIQPPPRSNQFIIAHSFPKELGLGQIPDMGSVVVKPRGQGKGYEVISRLSFSELTSLLF